MTAMEPRAKPRPGAESAARAPGAPIDGAEGRGPAQ